MSRIPPALASFVALVAVALPAGAQGFNVDLYANSVSAVPSATFGAASGQAGTWNGIDCVQCEPQAFPLVDLSGQTTGVTLQMIRGGLADSCTEPALSADENALLSSGQRGLDASSVIDLRVTGLTAGFYDLYVYAGRGCGSSASTYVTTQVALEAPIGNTFARQQQDSEGDSVPGTVFFERGNFVRLRVQVESGQHVVLHLESLSLGWFSAHGLQIVPLSGNVIPVCFGASDAFGCPCGPGVWGHGCGSSIHNAGAGLTGSGVPSVTSDTLVLSAEGLSNSVATFFQGTNLIGQGTGAVFGDGLRCAGGATVRVSTRQATSGMAAYPSTGEPTISMRGHVPLGGGTRVYQVLYRDPAPFCTSATFNATNAVNVVWSP